MPSPARPSKIEKNKPTQFKETMAATMPQAPAVRGLSDSQLRFGIYAIWIAATVIAGAAVGLYLAGHQVATTQTVNPSPVATADLAVQSVPTASVHVVPSSSSTSDLKVAPSYSVSQASAGTPEVAASAGSIQATTGPASLQPGYTAHNSVQGTVGTSPVQ